MGGKARPPARKLLRRDEFGLGAARDQRAKYAGKDSGAMHFPGIHPQAAEWLIKERRVAGLAVDTLSLDHGPSRDFKHASALAAVRALGHREHRQSRQGAGAGATLVVGLPKVKDASGGPARILALV